MKASASTIAATVLFLVVASMLISAFLALSLESVEVMRGLYVEYVRAHSSDVRWDIEDGKIVLYSPLPAKVVAVLAVSGGEVNVLSGDFVLDKEYELSNQASDKVVVIFEGGKFMVIDRENLQGAGPNESLGVAVEDLQASTKLLPLLARYLDPRDYLRVVEDYIPVEIGWFQLRPGYTPLTQSGDCSQDQEPRGFVCRPASHGLFLYIEIRWDSSNWYVTYRRGSPSGQVLDAFSIPRSSTSVPHREFLYHRECAEQNGVRHCFEVHATAGGYCDWGCGDPPNSRWYFEVGMRVVYRFEPIDPSHRLLVVLNRTTFDAVIGRGCATCLSYTGYPGGCVECSTRPGVGWCNVDGQQLVQLLGGPRPAFLWEVSYPQWLEDAYGDDGYELGAWYPHTSVSPPSWGQSEHYRYSAVPAPSVSVAFHVSGVYARDYLARTASHQYGYYRLHFDLILDEGGLGGDSRTWDYRVAVISLRLRSV